MEAISYKYLRLKNLPLEIVTNSYVLDNDRVVNEHSRLGSKSSINQLGKSQTSHRMESPYCRSKETTRKKYGKISTLRGQVLYKHDAHFQISKR